MGHLSSGKGTSGDWLIKRIFEEIADTGCAGAKILLKCDQETARMEVQQRAIAPRTPEGVPKRRPVGESLPNGGV